MAQKITTVDSMVYVDGSDTGLTSALSSLSTITATGWLNLENSAKITTTGSLTNHGELDAEAFARPNPGAGSTGGSTLKVGGTFTQNGRAYLGTYQIYKPVRIEAASFDNSGFTYVNTGKDRSNTPGVASFAASLQSPFLTGITTTVAIAGATNNSGLLWLATQAQLTTASFTQAASGKSVFGLAGTSAFPGGAVKASGPVTLKGGTIQVDMPPLGTSQVLVSFAPGTLTGIADHLVLRNGFSTVTGSGTSVRAPDGTLVGLYYDNARGTISLTSAAPVSTTVDTFRGGGGLTDATRWSSGLPMFYSDVVIAPHIAPVSLDVDATINSLTIGAGDVVSTNAGTDLSIGSSARVGSGATLKVGGQMTVDSAFTNDGLVTIAGRADIRGNTYGSGQFSIGDNGLLELGAASTSRVEFAGKNVQLKLDTSYLFTGTLADISIGDSIDLVGVKAGSVRSVGGQSLIVSKTDGSSQTIKLDGVQGRSAFGVQDDGAGGSRVTLLAYGPPRGPQTLPTFSGALAAAPEMDSSRIASANAHVSTPTAAIAPILHDQTVLPVMT